MVLRRLYYRCILGFYFGGVGAWDLLAYRSLYLVHLATPWSVGSTYAFRWHVLLDKGWLGSRLLGIGYPAPHYRRIGVLLK